MGRGKKKKEFPEANRVMRKLRETDSIEPQSLTQTRSFSEFWLMRGNSSETHCFEPLKNFLQQYPGLQHHFLFISKFN